MRKNIFCNQITQNDEQISQETSLSGKQTYKYYIYNVNEQEEKVK